MASVKVSTRRSRPGTVFNGNVEDADLTTKTVVHCASSNPITPPVTESLADSPSKFSHSFL